MKIAESAIQFASSHTYVEKNEERESLTAWKNDASNSRKTVSNSGGRSVQALNAALFRQSAKVKLSKEVQALQSQKAVAPENEEFDVVDDLNMSLLKNLIERFTGRKIQIMRPQDLKNPSDYTCETPARAKPAEIPTESEREGWGLIYDHYEFHYESESTAFAAEGLIRTADGREIDFSANLAMSREFMSASRTQVRAGDVLKDPLVINFDGGAAELTQTRFAFDLDMDGREDQIAFVREGSGFLALDKNGDGTVNDGSELFGPASGNGFSELAAYDEDGNQWIDENDDIFNRLRIWSRDTEGNDRLVALGAAGVGAIYLGHIDTPFLLKDSENSLQGAIRTSGIHIAENGSVGTIQQLDLSV